MSTRKPSSLFQQLRNRQSWCFLVMRICPPHTPFLLLCLHSPSVLCCSFSLFFSTTHSICTVLHYIYNNKTKLKDIKCSVFFLLCMWLFIKANKIALFRKRLQAARQKTAGENRRVWEILQSADSQTALILSDQSEICSVSTSLF